MTISRGEEFMHSPTVGTQPEIEDHSPSCRTKDVCKELFPSFVPHTIQNIIIDFFECMKLAVNVVLWLNYKNELCVVEIFLIKQLGFCQKSK